MKLKHAQMILSGKYYYECVETDIWVVPNKKNNYSNESHTITLSEKDMQFALRHLAMKVVGEKEKGK